MPVHVDQLSTEVIPEPEPPERGSGQESRWQELMRWRQLQANAIRDRLRTSAEGFDD